MQSTSINGAPVQHLQALNGLRGEVQRSWKRVVRHTAVAAAALAMSVVEIGGVLLLPQPGVAHAAAPQASAWPARQVRLILPEMHGPLL